MSIAIRASRLLLDSSSQLVDDGVVLVENKRIKEAGPWATLQKKLEGIPLKDLGNVTLMPGLFDCHVCHNSSVQYALWGEVKLTSQCRCIFSLTQVA